MDTNNGNFDYLCRSTFKNGTSTTKGEFTDKWIELINRLEKSKSVCASA